MIKIEIPIEIIEYIVQFNIEKTSIINIKKLLKKISNKKINKKNMGKSNNTPPHKPIIYELLNIYYKLAYYNFGILINNDIEFYKYDFNLINNQEYINNILLNSLKYNLTFNKISYNNTKNYKSNINELSFFNNIINFIYAFLKDNDTKILCNYYNNKIVL